MIPAVKARASGQTKREQSLGTTAVVRAPASSVRRRMIKDDSVRRSDTMYETILHLINHVRTAP